MFPTFKHFYFFSVKQLEFIIKRSLIKHPHWFLRQLPVLSALMITLSAACFYISNSFHQFLKEKKIDEFDFINQRLSVLLEEHQLAVESYLI